jgi:hypothetical protein
MQMPGYVDGVATGINGADGSNCSDFHDARSSSDP